MMIRLILLIMLLTSCHASPPLHHQQFYVFGTLVEISIWGVTQEQAQRGMEAVAKDFQTMHHNWHAWHPSPLTELNQAIRTGQPFTVQEPSLIPLLQRAQTLSQQSNGLFNPTIGQLIALWGFHQDELIIDFPPPSDSTIAALVALAPSMNDIEINGNQVSSHNPAVQFDLGAFAKGYAVDLAIQRLEELGIHNAIVNAGGNLKAIGSKGDQPWRIGIRHPSGNGVLAAVTIHGKESVITSGNYERFHEYQGTHYSHIIDPRTGKPTTGLVSVTVIHPDGALADAASTALTVAGLQNWQPIAKQMGLQYVMLVDEAGTVYMNSAMAERVQFDPENQPRIVMVELFRTRGNYFLTVQNFYNEF